MPEEPYTHPEGELNKYTAFEVETFEYEGYPLDSVIVVSFGNIRRDKNPNIAEQLKQLHREIIEDREYRNRFTHLIFDLSGLRFRHIQGEVDMYAAFDPIDTIAKSLLGGKVFFTEPESTIAKIGVNMFCSGSVFNRPWLRIEKAKSVEEALGEIEKRIQYAWGEK
ncbi:hypothetical protein JW796_01910 [Candidatus Dojkabacteria bacterium]|nr:hypothetical protein [Candidatus Dojkabacteria bacterium]